MNYHSRVNTIGKPDAAVVRVIQGRLNQLGFGPINVGGLFGKTTKSAENAY